MIATDAVLKRVRLWAEHGLQSQLSDLVAAVAHIDAQADHITALTAERDAAVAEVAQIVAYIRDRGRLGVKNKNGDRMLDGVVELMAHGALGLADAIAAGAHKETTDAQ